MRRSGWARRAWLRRQHADPLAEAVQCESARTTALATLAWRLSVARSFDEVGAAIAEHAAPALDADFAIVGLVTGDRFRTLALSGPHLDVLAPYADLPLDSDFPGLVALRLRDVVTFSSLDAVPDPGVAADLEALGLHAGACAPLSTADGTPLGALTVLWSAPPDVDETLRGRIDTVADLCEWYDGIALGGDRLCLVVGDVAGHGLDAVAEMVQLRTVVHTTSTPPSLGWPTRSPTPRHTSPAPSPTTCSPSTRPTTVAPTTWPSSSPEPTSALRDPTCPGR